MSDKTMPDLSDVSLTSDVVDRAVAQTLLAEGFHLGLITDAESAVADAHHLMSVVTIAPLKDHSDAQSTTGPTVKFWMTTPFKNPSVPDHEPPDVGSLCVRNMQAIFGTDPEDGGIPYFPRRDKDTKEFTYNGEPIDESQVEQIKHDLTTQALSKALECLKDPSTLVSDQRAVIFKVEHKEWNGRTTAQVTGLFPALPAKASFVPVDQMKVKVSA